MTDNNTRYMHLGVCDDCQTVHAVWPHPERRTEIPDINEGENFGTTCDICDGRIEWLEVVPVTDYLKRGF